MFNISSISNAAFYKTLGVFHINKLIALISYAVTADLFLMTSNPIDLKKALSIFLLKISIANFSDKISERGAFQLFSYLIAPKRLTARQSKTI